MDEDLKAKTLPVTFAAVVVVAAGSCLFAKPFGWIGSLATLVLGALTFGVYWLKRVRERRNRERLLAGAIEQDSSVTPTGLTADERAKVEQMRGNFLEGVEAFKRAGRSVYEVPWYVFVGEPASGKTEAIRHSHIRFLDRLNKPNQGAGGTIGMNWWFTRDGILLDTAGKLMFNSYRPGNSSEWIEFLKQLKRNRPACPINGLFLFLSVQSLIRDTQKEIEQKSARIAQQLDLIRSNLDVRFPVYVVVSKSDLLTGFREFFEDLSEESQIQMLGWSNPEPLDSPFHPELLRDSLKQIADRLRRRRMALLRQTAPQLQRRRADEVDALYALPQSLERLYPRLQRYVEAIFAADEWSSRPLFLRGIYFTSALREGSALDAVLATALGRPADQIDSRDLKAWARDKTYFLRDAFLEKAFPERGLVTTATNTRQVVRRRQLIGLGVGSVALVLLIIFAWIGRETLLKGMQDEVKFVRMVTATNLWDPSVPALFAPALVRSTGDSPTVADVNPATVNLDSKAVSYAHLCPAIATKMAGAVSVPLVYRPLAKMLKIKDIDGLREGFQTRFVTHSLLWPLVRYAREQLQKDTSRLNRTNRIATGEVGRLSDALTALAQMEVDAIHRTTTLSNAGEFARSLVAYTVPPGSAPAVNAVFSNAFTRAYGVNRGAWPVAALTAAGGESNAVSALTGGARLLTAKALASQRLQQGDLELLVAVEKALNSFAKIETDFLRGQATLEQLRATKDGLDLAIKATVAGDLAKGGLRALAREYADLLQRCQDASNEATAPLVRLISSLQSPPPYLVEMTNEMQKIKSGGVAAQVEERLKAYPAQRDYECLTNFNQERVYVARYGLYAGVSGVVQKAEALNGNAFEGDRWKTIAALLNDLHGLDTNVVNYHQAALPLAGELQVFWAGQRAAAQKHVIEAISKYVERARGLLADYYALKPAEVDTNFLSKVNGFLTGIEGDLKERGVLTSEQRELLERLDAKVNEARQGIVKYADNISEEINGWLRFPLKWSSEELLLPASVVGLTTRILELQKTVREVIPGYEPLQRVGQELDAISKLVNALVGNKGTLTMKRGREYAGYRFVAGANGTAVAGIDSSTADNTTLSFSLTNSVAFGIWPGRDSVRATDNSFSYPGGWGILQMLKHYDRERKGLKPNRVVWEIALPVTDGKSRWEVWVTVTFDVALPENWP